ncbi:4Fe-4S binding protein [Elusimicrobiota bacterium]
MKFPKIRELKEAIKAFIKGPYTTKFPQEPHVPYEGFRGKPIPSDEKCIGCGACANVCPANAIELKDNITNKQAKRELIWHYDLCIFCGQCESLCTTEDGVKLSAEFELSTFTRDSLYSKIEKELVVCECCKTVIAPKEHILWLIKKLGPLSSGNFNLFYMIQKELKVAKDLVTENDSLELQRPDLYRILCPKCRHQVIVFNQTGGQFFKAEK